MSSGRDVDVELAKPGQRVELAGRAGLGHEDVGPLDSERLGRGDPRDPRADHDDPPAPEPVAHPRPPLLMKST
jgi:hypothetical protein